VAKIIELAAPTNGAKESIAFSEPYQAEVKIEGIAPLLMHAWSPAAVDQKAAERKGSKGKKTDNLESYVYRHQNGELAIPGTYLRGAIITAAKFKQDPRSPRKSAADLYKAGVHSLTDLAPLGSKDWDFLDRRRVLVQRSAINRTRPAMHIGWTLTFVLSVVLPEYISSQELHDVITSAGKLVGLGDFRPTYGRYQIVSWKIL
jgi:hypothetical protein